MQIDRYTKVMLTIIAGCLIWLSLGGVQVLPAAHAQVPPPPARKPLPSVIPAGDLGYRVDYWRGPGEAPIGTLVVRIDGTWYEARLDYMKR